MNISLTIVIFFGGVTIDELERNVFRMIQTKMMKLELQETIVMWR